MKWSWWSAQMRHDATSTTCWMTERSWPKRSATSNSRWMQGSDRLQKSGWDVNSLLFSTLTFRTSGHPVHKQIDMLQRINPFAFCCPFSAASHTDHLRAGEPGGAGGTSGQTGGEPGDRDGPQVSLTKQLSSGRKQFWKCEPLCYTTADGMPLSFNNCLCS